MRGQGALLMVVRPPVHLPAPPEIEAAARQWWEEQQAGS